MLPILKRAATRSMSRKMMGRKTNVRVGQAQPQSSNAIVKSEKFVGRSAKAPLSLPRPPADVQGVSEKVSKDDPIKVIHTKTLTIEKILQGTLASEKAELKRKKNDFKNQNRQEQEENLEKKDVKPDKKMKMPKVPGSGGIFGFIKNFLGNIIMGFFLMKLVDNIGMLKGIFSTIVGIGDFIADFGIKLVDGLATFVDWGYKAYDATQGFLANFGVKPELFDQFSGALSGLIDALIIGSVILAARGEDGFGPGGLDKARKPASRRGVTTGRGGQKPPRFSNPLRRSPVTRSGKPGMPGAPVTQGRGGQGTRPRFPGTGPKVTGGTPRGGFKVPRLPRLPFGGVARNLAGPFINTLLAIWDFSGRKSAGQTNVQAGVGTGGGILGSIAGAAIAATLFPEPISSVAGLLTLGILGSLGYALGSAGADKLTGADKVGQYQEGGRVRKPIKRSIGGKKRSTSAAKKLIRKPTPEKLPDLPQPKEKGGKNRAWWDFLGWAGTGNQPLGPGGEQLAQKVTDVGNDLGENDFFGPILRVTSKIILDQEVNSKDIKNVGLGINFLINKGLTDEKISKSIRRYAEGGMVSPLSDTLSLEKWVEESFKPIVKKEYPTRYTSGSGTTGPMGEGEYDSATGEFMKGNVQGAALNMNDKQAFATVYELAKKHKAKFPEIVAAQAMHETGYLSEDLASVFNSTGRTNAFGQTGDRGYGTIPRKNEPIGWTKYPSLDKAVEDNIKLWHRVSNHPQNYEAFETPIEGILAVVGNYSPNEDPANIAKGYDEGSYVHAMQKILMSMGFDPYKANKKQDLSDSAVLQRVSPIGDAPGSQSSSPGSGGALGGDGKFIQGNSGYSKGVHFHIGPGHQTDGTLLQSQYKADARASAKKVLDHFLGKGSKIYDGRRGVFYESSDEVNAAQRAHESTGGSLGGIDMQVDFETPHKFPLNVSSMAYRRNGFGVSANIEGSKSFVAHGRYDEKGNVAPQEALKVYHAGLRLGGKEQIAKILKGETILDEDTSKALGSTLLARLDDASTPAGIQKVLQSVMGISEFPSYDSRAGQVIIIDDSDEAPMAEQPAPVMIGALGGTSYDNSMDFLDYQG